MFCAIRDAQTNEWGNASNGPVNNAYKGIFTKHKD